MVVATGSNLFSQTWNMAHAIISGNVVDPVLASRSTSKLKMIFGAFPDMEYNRPDFPIIIIDNPQITSSNITMPTGGIIGKTVTIPVRIYSKSNEQLNVLTDDVTDAFMNNKAVFSNSGLQLTGTTIGPASTDILANVRIHFKEIRANMNTVV